MDKIRKTQRNEHQEIMNLNVHNNEDEPKLELTKGSASIINAPGTLPIYLDGPHSANFQNLTLESHEAAEAHFQQKSPQDQKPEAEGLWNKAKATIWGGISYCANLAGVKLSSGEVQQASKIMSAGRKFQAGIAHAWDTQNLFNLTHASKTHLDYGLSALSAASGLYKFVVKHGKDGAKHAKMLGRIDAMSETFESACDQLDSTNEKIAARLDLIKKEAEKNPELSEAFAATRGQLAKIEEEILELKSQEEPLDEDAADEIQMQLEALLEEYEVTQTGYKELLHKTDANLSGTSLEELQGNLREIEKEISRSNADITQLLHEAHELSKRECITDALLQVAGNKSVVTGVKTVTDYGSDYSAILSDHSKAIKGYLNNYLMVPIFVTGLSVSLYGSYTLGHNYSNRSEIEATAQNMLSENPEDPELEAFISLVASKQRTTQALLSFGSAIGKAAQNALALGVAFGGISLASATTGISEEVLNTVITPVGWAIGGVVACTSLGLKTYQNYQESNRQQQEEFWTQILHESNSDAPIASLSEDYKDLAEAVIQEMELADPERSPMELFEAMRDDVNAIIKNQAILNLMKLNVDFAAGIITARLTSSDERTAESTKHMLQGLGIQDADIENLRTMSPQVASGALKEKLCLL